MCEMFKDEFFFFNIENLMNSSNLEVFAPPKKSVKLKGDLHGFAILAKFLSKTYIKAQDDGKEQMRCAFVEGGKKNQKPYYAGSWVFSEQGRGRADCYPIITVTQQWWWLLYKILLVKEEKTAEKSNNKSI